MAVRAAVLYKDCNLFLYLIVKLKSTFCFTSRQLESWRHAREI